MTKGLNEQVEEFRERSLSNTVYPVLWVDALYEKVRVNGRIVSMAILVVCGVDETRRRDIVAAIQDSFSGASWALQGPFHAQYPGLYTLEREKAFAVVLKEIQMAPTVELARKRAHEVIDTYAKRFPKAIQCLKTDWRSR